MKVAGYGRMSTDKQQMSPEVQERKIKDWFKEKVKSGEIPKDAKYIGMFVDPAVTSRIDLPDRKVGQHLLTLLSHGDMVVCAKFDRAFRSPADCERTLRICKEAGLSFRFIDANIDEQSANGQLFAGMLALAAKYERDMRSETTRDALGYRMRTGHAVCNPPWGWKIDKRDRKLRVKYMKRLKADDTGRRIANAALHCFRSGMSKLQTHKAINESMKKNNIINYPKSHESFVIAAAAAAMGFPKMSVPYCSKVLGMKLQTLEFIRRDDHEEVRAELNKRLREDGFDV